MNASKLVLTILGLGVGLQLFTIGMSLYAKPSSKALATKSEVAVSTGFTEVATPAGVAANQVLIVGPNCNQPQGLRTKALAKQLAQRNIPYQQTDSVGVSSDAGWQNVARMNSLMQGDAPIVFINGKGKANPQVEEVVAEYKLATRP